MTALKNAPCEVKFKCAIIGVVAATLFFRKNTFALFFKAAQPDNCDCVKQSMWTPLNVNQGAIFDVN